jgi:formylglycine-generating enzyme required for sulfatase activity
LLLLAACGGGTSSSSGGGAGGGGGVTVSPARPSVKAADSVTLTVSTADFSFSVLPASGHGCVQSGSTIVCTPTLTGTYVVTVTSGGASKDVTLTVNPADPTVEITPDGATVKTTKTIRFSATVTIPQGQPQQDPVWGVTGDCGVIDEDGLFSAAKKSSGTCSVTASLTTYDGRTIKETVDVTVEDPTLSDILGEMVEVAAGSFTMGCDPSRDGLCSYTDQAPHPETVAKFYIGRTEVTQLLWRLAGMGTNPSMHTGDNLPVENVSWKDIVGTSGGSMVVGGVTYHANGFIYKLNTAKPGKNCRLPTEAEWEYAARGGARGAGHAYSGSGDVDAVAWYEGNSETDTGALATHPVETKQANELGVYDMSGNVHELVSDLYADSVHPTPDGKTHVVKGGGAWDAVDYVRVASRGGWAFDDQGKGDLGFRLVCESK